MIYQIAFQLGETESINGVANVFLVRFGENDFLAVFLCYVN